jgi:hypothetical protein
LTGLADCVLYPTPAGTNVGRLLDDKEGRVIHHYIATDREEAVVSGFDAISKGISWAF